MADEKHEGTEYRVLADAMLDPEVGNNRRYVRGDKVWIKDDRKAKSLLKHGGIVKEADATDAQKKLWEQDTEAAEKRKADEEARQKMEKEYAEAGGRKDNRTQEPKASELTPAGAPNVAKSTKS